MPFLLNRSLFTCLIMLVFSLHSQAQIQTAQSSSDFWNHVRFGGGIGLSLGDGFFSGTLAPSAIYEFNNQFALGIGLNGTYNTQKNAYKSTVLGGSLIGLFNPIPEIQLSAEFEELNVSRNWDDRFAIPKENYWYPALFVGAGFRSHNVAVGIRYDVLYDKAKSIYAEAWAPFVRVYF
ncbi:MAG: alpha-ketoglutarate decarboxylase [Gelidibacter sp.]|uniref:alpha-ketoglutarate decarboxylase n=1 Tax=Gelidibacter sp. TaxID=2018083 RepID=UPI0032669F41